MQENMLKDLHSQELFTTVEYDINPFLKIINYTCIHKINSKKTPMPQTTNYPTLAFNKFTPQYEHLQHPSHKLTVLYIHGLASNPWGRKPETVRSLCKEMGLDFFRFELLGHGADTANYEQTDFHLWKAQILNIIDNHIRGDFIIVGHCIGGWLALLAAQERPEHLKGIICTSTAPNLTELMQLKMSPEQMDELKQNGKVFIKIERMIFNFTQQFIQSGIDNAILEQTDIPINCPVHLIQGLKDTFIDWRVIFRIADKLQSPQVTIKLIKNGNHHLQMPRDLEEINNSLKNIANNI